MHDNIPDCFFCLNNPIFVGIMWRFAIDIVFLFILIRVVYFRYYKKVKFLFTFFLMGIAMKQSVAFRAYVAILFFIIGKMALAERAFRFM